MPFPVSFIVISSIFSSGFDSSSVSRSCSLILTTITPRSVYFWELGVSTIEKVIAQIIRLTKLLPNRFIKIYGNEISIGIFFRSLNSIPSVVHPVAW